MDIALHHPAIGLPPAYLAPPAARRQMAFHHCSAQDAALAGHDAQGKANLTRHLAGLLGLEFGEASPRDMGGDSTAPYLVPSDTLLQADARRFGILGPDDLFGGVVPHPFVATKAITHALVATHAIAPSGWSAPFTHEVKRVVLPGYTAFTHDDALEAAERLLRAHGVVRLKETTGVGGVGQAVLTDGAEASRRISALSPDVLGTHGVVLEHNLASLVTYSVGQVCLGGHTLSYHGTQGTTRNALGQEVYGGSTLTVVRGGFHALLSLSLPDEVQTAVRHAMVYHRAASRSFPGFFTSRANYDVVAGVDASGQVHCGVLEQSWRIGGASGAEIVALEAFLNDRSLHVVHASTHEIHGEPPPLPPGALMYFDGVDARVGRLRKYAIAQPHDA